MWCGVRPNSAVNCVILFGIGIILQFGWNAGEAIHKDFRKVFDNQAKIEKDLEYLFSQLDDRLREVENNISHNENKYLRDLIDDLLKTNDGG